MGSSPRLRAEVGAGIVQLGQGLRPGPGSWVRLNGQGLRLGQELGREASVEV